MMWAELMRSFFSVSQEPFIVDIIPEWLSKDIAVSALADGGWIVTWTAYKTENTLFESIAQQRFSATGETLGPPTFVNTYSDGSQYDASVAGLPDGGWVVTWASYQQDGSSHGVFQQRFNSDGRALGVETQVNTYTDGPQYSPSIAQLGDGGWVVTWISPDQAGNSGQIFQQRYTANGMPAGEETLVSVIGTAGHEPVVTPLENGGWITVWAAHGVDGSFGAIVQQAYASDGTEIGQQTQVNTHSDYVQSRPEVTALEFGGWVVTWQSSGQDFGYSEGIYQQAYSADGAPIGEETLVNSTVYFNQKNPTIVALEDGGWLVIWQSQNESGTNSFTRGHSNIIAQRYDASGGPLGGEVPLSDDPSRFNHLPEATLLENGDVAILWRAQNPQTFEYEIMTGIYEITPVFAGTDGSDVLIGSNGDDLLFGGAGNDTLNGGADDDTLMGGSGSDSMNGGSGVDVADYSDAIGRVKFDLLDLSKNSGEALGDTFASIEVFTGSAQKDTFLGDHEVNILNGELGNDDLRGRSGHDTLSGGGGNDRLDGGKGRDRLNGDDGDDTMYGTRGFDNMRGGRGNDTMDGGTEDDLLVGGRGNDLIIGGLGDDKMIGNQGADVFIFADGHGVDVISDFDAADDSEVLDVSAVALLNNFADVTHAAKGNARQVGNDVLFDTGGGNSIQLENVLISDLQAADFIF